MHFDASFHYPALAVLCSVVAACFDIKSRRIPNLLVGPAFLIAILLHAVVDGAHGLLTSTGAGLVGGGIFLLFYVLGGMGAGDVKLVAAVCALAGWSNLPFILILTGIAGGVMGVIVAWRHGRLQQTFRNALGLTAHHLKHGLQAHPEMNVRNEAMLRLPYGIAIAAGCTLTLWLRTAGH
jgi:prepilin peptidase CpaA